ncbi:MAG: biotin/lipoyl-containing protein, partial [Opitutaceae bacterium]
MTTVPVKIPPMGESITSGILAKWHVAEGATVRRDQPLFELETDKITSEATAETAGVIRLAVKAGDEVRIGQVVATIEAGAAAETPAAAPARPAPAAAAAVSPAVRRVAAETGLDPAKVTGTGKGGRVTKGDLLTAAAPTPAAPAVPAAPTPTPSAPAAAPAPAAAAARQTRRKLSPLRAR